MIGKGAYRSNALLVFLLDEALSLQPGNLLLCRPSRLHCLVGPRLPQT